LSSKKKIHLDEALLKSLKLRGEQGKEFVGGGVSRIVFGIRGRIGKRSRRRILKKPWLRPGATLNKKKDIEITGQVGKGGHMDRSL